jgi:hypothetical protein
LNRFTIRRVASVYSRTIIYKNHLFSFVCYMTSCIFIHYFCILYTQLSCFVISYLYRISCKRVIQVRENRWGNKELTIQRTAWKHNKRYENKWKLEFTWHKAVLRNILSILQKMEQNTTIMKHCKNRFCFTLRNDLENFWQIILFLGELIPHLMTEEIMGKIWLVDGMMVCFISFYFVFFQPVALTHGLILFIATWFTCFCCVLLFYLHVIVVVVYTFYCCCCLHVLTTWCCYSLHMSFLYRVVHAIATYWIEMLLFHIVGTDCFLFFLDVVASGITCTYFKLFLPTTHVPASWYCYQLTPYIY